MPRIGNNESSDAHMPWVRGKRGTLFQSKPVVIHASPEIVWSVAKDANHYYEHSKGAVWAHVDGEVSVRKKIALKLFRDKWIGKLIPQSDEYISKVDSEGLVLGWERVLPIGGVTERYQVIETDMEPDPDVGVTTHSYIALRVPGIVGFFSRVFLKSTIEKSFNELNEGIKAEAERLAVLS